MILTLVASLRGEDFVFPAEAPDAFGGVAFVLLGSCFAGFGEAFLGSTGFLADAVESVAFAFGDSMGFLPAGFVSVLVAFGLFTSDFLSATLGVDFFASDFTGSSDLDLVESLVGACFVTGASLCLVVAAGVALGLSVFLPAGAGTRTSGTETGGGPDDFDLLVGVETTGEIVGAVATLGNFAGAGFSWTFALGLGVTPRSLKTAKAVGLLGVE